MTDTVAPEGASLGVRFEREIYEQPEIWRAIAGSDKAAEFARAVSKQRVLFVGSGSSLFVSQLGALALRRRGIDADALAASEAAFDWSAFTGRAVVAISQSGRSADTLDALDRVEPSLVIALTNDAASPLAQRADLAIPIDAGDEVAVPASKSVTSSLAIVIWGAALVSGSSTRSATTLRETADLCEDFLRNDGRGAIATVVRRFPTLRSVAVVGAGYGGPIASEIALKIKEASYLHAEGFAAGEFRHGSAAILDERVALIGVVDDPSRTVVARPLAEAERAKAPRYTIGGDLPGGKRLGPIAGEAFNTLAWLLTGQLLALELGRARGVDSDAPRGQQKYLG